MDHDARPDHDDDWQASTRQSPSQAAIDRATGTSVPFEAVAFFARWWQLETWLRTLAYLELRAAFGVGWADLIDESARRRAGQDQANEYMPSPDADDLLAYLDTGALFALLDSDEVWPLVEPSLMPRERWRGLTHQLKALRNRSAHLRRPHDDDLRRVEQALRDLEPGAHRAMRSLNAKRRVQTPTGDPVAAAWVGEEHPDAQRLVAHAERQYRVDFSLWVSKRPWVRGGGAPEITGQRGYIWHANWYCRDGGFISPRRLWQDDQLDVEGTRDLVIHLLHESPHSVEATFAAVDDPSAVADAIGALFDAVLSVHVPRATRRMESRWGDEGRRLGSRVQVGTALTMDDPSTPFTIFAAQDDA